MVQCNILQFVLWRLDSSECSIINFSDPPSNIEEEKILNEYYLQLEKSSYLIWGLLAIAPKHDPTLPCPDRNALGY